MDFKPGEMRFALLAGLYFFCLLFGYFMLRPLRDAMGVERGIDSLRVLFLIGLGVMVVANLAFGFIASRLPRRVFVPLVYWFAIACLAGFLGVLLVAGEEPPGWVGPTFYVWLSVFNLFAVSVFWAFMADLFTLEQSKRLFGFIAVGGTAGAICGSAWTGVLAERIGDVGLFAGAIGLIMCAGVLAMVLGRHAGRPGGAATDAEAGDRGEPGPIGGVGWEGIRDVVRSRYLLGIGVYVCLFTILSTLVYFEKMRIVAVVAEDRESRAQVLAWIEFGGQTATILLQLFLTGRLMRRLGVAALLAVVPMVTIIGFVGMAALPGLVTIGVLEAARRACNHGLSKPARETLFTVVNRSEKYKAKGFIDTFVYRGGDTLGTLLHKGLGVLGVGLWMVAVPLGIAGIGVSVFLGARERRLAKQLSHSRGVDDSADGDGRENAGFATAVRV